jgi:hypothetical protein
MPKGVLDKQIQHCYIQLLRLVTINNLSNLKDKDLVLIIAT